MVDYSRFAHIDDSSSDDDDGKFTAFLPYRTRASSWARAASYSSSKAPSCSFAPRWQILAYHLPLRLS